MHNILPAALVLCLTLLTGCQSNLAMKRLAAKNPMAKNAAKTPVKMVDVWKTYAQTTPEGTAMRGIAGRIHFYDGGKKKRAVKVDGDLSVFVFDGNEKDPARAKPLKVYQFKAETLQKHYAFKKPLGHGYDFFLPFDEIDGEQMTLSVMTRFDDRLDGALVLAPPVNTILKGSKPEPAPETSVREFLASRGKLAGAVESAIDEATRRTSPSGIEQVAYQEEKADASGAPHARTVATISLSDQMTRRLSQAAPEPAPAPVSPGAASIYEPLPGALPRDMDSRLKVEKPDYPKVEYPERPF